MDAPLRRIPPRRHPRELGAPQVEQFLTFLAVHRKVSSATQNQALQALLFLYRHVLEVELPWLDNVTRAGNAKRLPVVLTRDEVRALLSQLQGTPWLVASLLYGSGLRLMEAMRLRVKDLAIERGEVIVREGKGGKDRVTMLPAALENSVRAHLERLRGWYEEERRRARPGVSLPLSLARKYPEARTRWGWRRRLRHPHRAGGARPRGPQDHHDLHARDGEGCARRSQPTRPARVCRPRHLITCGSASTAMRIRRARRGCAPAKSFCRHAS